MQDQGVGKRRKYFFVANKFQGKVLFLIFLSVVIPLFVSMLFLSYLIFTVLNTQMVVRDAVVFDVFPMSMRVMAVVLIFTSFVIVLILIAAYKVSNRLLGPLGRLYRELDDRIKNNSKQHIVFRKGDDLMELANKINTLLDKLP